MESVDDLSRATTIRAVIEGKRSLRRYYEQVYRRYEDCLRRCPHVGRALEIGSGAGFTKAFVPDIITSDIIPYSGVDQVLDCLNLPFPDASLRFIAMHNVFHHVSDVEKFLGEVTRTLVPGGRLFIVDQHVGLISRPILTYLHSEAIDTAAKKWRFLTSGPLSGANGALAWIVFNRDRQRFIEKYPQLRLERYAPHTPLYYWLTGGLKVWNLLPPFLISPAEALDRALIRLHADLGSFVDIEVYKVGSVQ